MSKPPYLSAPSTPREVNRALVRAARQESRDALLEWRSNGGRIIWAWLLIASLIAGFMLASVLAISVIRPPTGIDARPYLLDARRWSDVSFTLYRNLQVLALHGFICLAGYMARRTLPVQIQFKQGIDRWIHEYLGRWTMIIVVLATAYSITSQIWIIGLHLGNIAVAIDLPQSLLLLSLAPHAMIELTAVFLPMAALLMASRRGEWNTLLAATLLTALIALPMLSLAALIEVFVWPGVLRSLIAPAV